MVRGLIIYRNIYPGTALGVDTVTQVRMYFILVHLIPLPLQEWHRGTGTSPQ